MVENRNKYTFTPLAMMISVLVLAGAIAFFFYYLNKNTAVMTHPDGPQIEHHETEIEQVN